MNILPVTLMERTACFSMPRRASRRLPYVIAVFLAVFISSLLAGGAIPEAQAFGAPRILPYQGRLLDSSGTPLGGTAGAGYCFRFSFYTTPVVGAGTKLWPVGAPASMLSTVKNGLFALSIGDTSAGGDTLDFNFASAGALYLNVEVANTVAGSCTGSNFETLSPRQRIGAVAYALQSNSVAGSEPSVFGSSTPFTDTAVSIQAPSAATTPLKIRAASGQAVNLLEIQDALATRLLTVDSIGGLSSSSTLGVSGPARLYSTLMVDGLSTFSGGLLVNAASSTITTLRTSNFFATSSTLTTANITSLNLLGGTVTGLSLTNLSGTNVLAFLGNAQTFTAANNFSATTTFAVTSAASSSITQANIAKLVVSGTLQLPANSLTDAMIPDAITASNYLPLTGGTVSGLTILQNGFIASTSSSIAGGLQVAGALNASSTLFVKNLATFNAGFLSNATSTILGGLQVAGTLTNSGNLQVTGGLTVTGGANFAALSTFATTTIASGTLTTANIKNLSLLTGGTVSGLSLTNVTGTSALAFLGNAQTFSGLNTFTVLTNFQTGFITSASSSFAKGLQVAGALNASSTLFVKNLATFNAGFLANATSSVLGGLQVSGNLINSGNLQVVGGSSFTGPASFVTTTIASGTLTTANIKNLTLLTGGTVAGLSLSNVTGTSGLSFLANNQVFTGLNNFTALTIFQSGLISSASSSFAKGLQVAGALNASSTLFVKNLATFNAGFFSNATSTILGGLQVAGTLTVSGAGSFSNLVTLSGGFTALTTSSISGPFSMTGPTTISASLLSSGLITTTGGFISTASSTFVSGLQVSGPLNASSTLLVKNLASFGSNVNISGNLNASGTLFVTGNILPGLNNVSNLGARGAAWGNVFASGTLEFSGGSASGGLRLVASNSTTTLISLVTGAGAGAFVLDTVTTLPPTSSTLLLSVRNNTKKVFSVDASGNVRTTGTITSNASGATMGDLAEYVDISPGETVEAGDIVVVDPDRPNKFKKSSTAYTLGVAGVISDTGRFLIGASGEGRAALGLAGLVKVKASNENGPISVGDYVVTASQPGLAMRFKPDDTHATAVVGVAVEPLTAETGTITIIISHGLVMPGASAGLRVDVIGSAGTELGILSDTVFFGRPYLNADSGGFALINPGDKFVAVSFEREYLDQPVVTASISLDDPALNGSDASFDSGATPEEIIFNNQMQYLIAKKSTHGFTILLNKPAPVAMRFSWQALAIKHPRLSVSGSALVATPSISIPVPSAATTPIEPAVPTMKNPPVSTAPDREAAPPNATSHAANPEPPAEVPTATPSE